MKNFVFKISFLTQKFIRWLRKKIRGLRVKNNIVIYIADWLKETNIQP